MDDKALILDFLGRQALGVIATVNAQGKPESAVIGFGQTADLELIFGTSIKSRKAANLQRDPSISFVTGWDEGKTIQYQGEARLLEGDEVKTYQEIYFAKSPTARKYAADPDETCYLIKPTWIRYTDLNYTPWIIKELIF